MRLMAYDCAVTETNFTSDFCLSLFKVSSCNALTVMQENKRLISVSNTIKTILAFLLGNSTIDNALQQLSICPCLCRHGLRVAAKASVAESSQDMDDLELEEELEEAYNDEIPIEMKLPGGKASAYAGRRGRQSDTSDGGRKKAEDALQERILQVSTNISCQNVCIDKSQ